MQYLDNAKKHELRVAEPNQYFLIFSKTEIGFKFYLGVFATQR